MEAVQNDTTVSPAAFSRNEFNRNRKIVLKSVSGITVEVMKSDYGMCLKLFIQ